MGRYLVLDMDVRSRGPPLQAPVVVGLLIGLQYTVYIIFQSDYLWHDRNRPPLRNLRPDTDIKNVMFGQQGAVKVGTKNINPKLFCRLMSN
jgi:hypothetical protein